ncbi:helix-turn-helix domain-containing protein [Effusibacillus dendaii]|uniref:Transcription regulator TrmB N-terminal domain-containing protein n=1 Tax=Effusibacillus dendaii TaxID=2743772 RepID=A0A7I8D9M7_9BACL|nr:helix-turn-helix domain-containing protein [Effusibacillus dendaii]BCJ85526.1 hypothetical protein skT53_05110 [Effusibacillus dendaii]
MACGKSESSLTQSEINAYLSVIQEKPATSAEISTKMKLPLFKVRSNLRELIELGYLRVKEDQYAIIRLE